MVGPPFTRMQSDQCPWPTRPNPCKRPAPSHLVHVRLAGTALRHLVVLGTVAGVGFTMALFIAELAFTAPELLSAAKLGVLAASGLAALVGLGCGRLLLTRSDHSTR
jgi:Na+/H+ antiporter NhaA